MRLTRNQLEKWLDGQEKSAIAYQRVLIQYHYPAGSTPEEVDQISYEAKETYKAEHPEYQGARLAFICLGLAYDETQEEPHDHES